MKNADAAAPKCGEKRDEIGPKFLYLNECNLRHEGTLGSSEDSPSRDLINILMDQYEDRDEKNISAETIVKSMKDYWVVTKRSNSRVLFVLINRYATLLEIAGNVVYISDCTLHFHLNYCLYRWSNEIVRATSERCILHVTTNCIRSSFIFISTNW